MNELEKVINIIKESDNIVFFGGAGVSTESGIPDFRSNTGLYKKEYVCNGRKEGKRSRSRRFFVY